MMEINNTNRGFGKGEFSDLYNQKCSIQESSLATQDAIWLGINDPKLVVFKDETRGAYIETIMPANFNVNARMHLNRDQVAEILPLLTSFVENGTLYPDLSNNADKIDTVVDKLTTIQLNLASINDIDPIIFNELCEKIGDIKEALVNMDIYHQ